MFLSLVCLLFIISIIQLIFSIYMLINIKHSEPSTISNESELFFMWLLDLVSSMLIAIIVGAYLFGNI